MPFLKDTDIDERIKSPDNLVNRLTIHEINRSTGPQTPQQIKKVIAILGNESDGGSCRELAKVFGIGKATVNNIENGNTVDEEVKALVKKTRSQTELNRESAESVAVSTLLDALNLIPDNLERPKKAKQISSVAKDMAMISNMMGNRNNPDGKGERAMHVHLYGPRQKKVSDYDIIDVEVKA